MIVNRERKERKEEEEEIPRAHYAGGNDDKWRGCVSGKKVSYGVLIKIGVLFSQIR